MAQIAINEEDVEVALMVGEEDVGLLRVDMFAAFDPDGDEEEPTGDARPPFRPVVADVVVVAEQRCNDYSRCNHNGDDGKQRQGDAEAVDFIENLEH